MTGGIAITPDVPAALKVWWRIGWLSFGGPAGQIALMHTELVDRRRWVDESSSAHGLNYCMLLPGPEAMQLACYLGWRLHGTVGGLLAGALFVLPGALLMLLLAWLFVSVGSLPAVAGVLLGLQAAVLGIVLNALQKMARKMLTTRLAIVLAAAALLGLVGDLPFPLVILLAALAGTLAARWQPAWLPAAGHPLIVAAANERAGRLRSSITLAGALIAAWWLPLLIVAAVFGTGSTAWSMGVFFSQAALVTFGGAYAVLPYVAQQAVENYGWLNAGQMLAGLGLAESTPGPLILVLQFVAYVGGWQNPDVPNVALSALLCACVALWATFLPSFLFVLPAAPWIERLRQLPLLMGALAGVGAAVVGVIAHLALWFGWQMLGGSDWVVACFVLAVAVFSWIVLQRQRVPLPLVVALAGVAGGLFAATGGMS